jgi:hypothetical protein
MELRMSLKASVLQYKSSFDRTQMDTVKLQQRVTAGGDSYSTNKKNPVFDGTGGIDALLFVEDQFRRNAAKLLFDTGAELFDNFDECLSGTAATKWNTLTRGIPTNERTTDKFDETIEAFYRKYCPGDARDVMVDYLDEVRQPRKMDPDEHLDRME